MYVEPKYNEKYAKSVKKSVWLSDYEGEAKEAAEKWYDEHIAEKPKEAKEASK